jgi:Sporulation protein Cse60
MMIDEKVKVVGAYSTNELEEKINTVLNELRETSNSLVDIKFSTSSVENPMSSIPDTNYNALVIYK